MKFKAFPLTVTIAALVLSGSALAKDGSPTVFGTLNAGVTKSDSSDIDGQAFEASLGVKGLFKKEDFKLLYKLEAEFTEAVNNSEGKSELEIKNAVIVMPTADYGTFVVASRGESVHQRDLYGPVDIFEINEANNSTLWGQPDEATSVFAYKTPTFANTYISVATLTLNSKGTPDANNNDSDVDVFAIRAIYKNEGLYLGIGNASVAKEQTGASKTYNRSAFTAGYDFNNVHLGLTWEHQNDHPAPFASDSDIVGVVADVDLSNKWSVGVGYTDKDSEHDAWDDSATMLIVRNQILENVYAYAEIADYENSDDNYSAGININF